jgi:hypothetical protein
MTAFNCFLSERFLRQKRSFGIGGQQPIHSGQMSATFTN